MQPVEPQHRYRESCSRWGDHHLKVVALATPIAEGEVGSYNLSFWPAVLVNALISSLKLHVVEKEVVFKGHSR